MAVTVRVDGTFVGTQDAINFVNEAGNPVQVSASNDSGAGEVEIFVVDDGKAKAHADATPDYIGNVLCIQAPLKKTVDTGTSVVRVEIEDFQPSGTGHARGAVPDPPASSGTTKFLREDAAWAVPAGLDIDGLTAADLAAADAVPFYDASAAANRKATVARLGGFIDPGICQGRLTTESGVPVSTSDRAAQGTLYFTPYKGNRIALYDGTRWNAFALSEIGLALSSLTAGRPYDVFVYDNSGTPTLEFLAWTSGTARATALTTQDGILVKSGATTRRYVGTFYTSGTATTEDTASQRFVWNYYNRITRKLKYANATGHSYSSTTIRAWNNSGAARVELVVGWTEDAVQIAVTMRASKNTNNPIIWIGVDSTTAAVSDDSVALRNVNAGAIGAGKAILHLPSVGYHYVAPLEASSASGAADFDEIDLHVGLPA